LFCNDGSWKGKQLVSEKWIDMATQPSQANSRYGYLWWLNTGEGKMEGVPEHVFYAAGFGGNYIVVDQENKIVVVTRWLEPSQLAEMLKLVYEALD
jgi:CubicO group peptidase (beta-lactamase class C family)